MIKKAIKKTVKSLLNNYTKYKLLKIEKQNIKNKKNLIQKVSLNNSQIQDVEKIWIENYGKKIPLDWHKLYTSYYGKFDKFYFPEIFFTTNLLEKLNPDKRKNYLSDKVLTQFLFRDIDYKKFKLINTYIYNCNGYFYDDNRIYYV